MLNRATLRFSTNFLVLVTAASLIFAGFFVYLGQAQAQEEPASAPVGGDPPELGTPPGTTPGLEPGGEQALPTAEGEAPPGATPGAAPGEAGPTGEAPTAPSAELQAELAKLVIESEKSDEVRQDEGAVLGEPPRILPDNPLYVFKSWGRGLQKAFTFDPVKKAELELKHANNKLIECETLIEKKGDDVDPKLINKVLGSAESDLDSLAKRADTIKDRKGDDKELVDDFTDKLADRQIKHAKFLDRLAEKLPETIKTEILDKLTEVKEASLENSAKVLGTVETAEELAETLTAALDAQAGSEFKNFKNLEVLEALGDRLPEEALQGLDQAKENAFKRLHENITQLSETERDKFKKYVEFMPGHGGRQVELLDDFKSILGPDELAPDFINQLNVVKEKAFKKFEDQFKSFTDKGARERFLDPFKNTNRDTGDFRVISQLKDRIGSSSDIPEDLKKEVEQVQQDSFTKFREKFTDSKALETVSQAEGFFKKFRDNPDAVDFKVIEDLRNSLSPEQRQFVEKMEEDVGAKFAARFAQVGPPGGASFGDFFSDPTDPNSIKVLEGLKGRLPEAARQGIEQAIGVQRDGFREHVQSLDDPFILGRIQNMVGQDESLKKSFAEGDATFFQKLDSRRQEFETKFRADAQQRFETFSTLLQGIQQGPPEEGGEFAPPSGLSSESADKFNELRQKFQSGGFGQFDPLGGVRGGPSQGAPGVPGATGGQFPGGGEQPQLGAPLDGFPGGGITGGQFPRDFGAGGFKAEDFLNIGKFIGAPPPTFFHRETGGAKTGEGKEEGGLPGGFPGTGGEFPGAGGFPGTGGAPGGFPLPTEGGAGEGFPLPSGSQLPGATGGQFPGATGGQFPGGGSTGGKFPGGGATGGEFPGGPSSLGVPSFGAPSRQPSKGGGESTGPFFTPSKTEGGSSLGAPKGGAPSGGGTSPFGEFPGAFPSKSESGGEHKEPFFAPKSEGGLGAPSFPGSLPSGGTQPGGGLPSGGQGTQGGLPSFGTPGTGQQPSGGLPSGGDFHPPPAGDTHLPSGLPPVGGSEPTGGLAPSGGSAPTGGGTPSPPPSGDSGGGGTFSPPPSGDGGGGGGSPPPPAH